MGKEQGLCNFTMPANPPADACEPPSSACDPPSWLSLPALVIPALTHSEGALRFVPPPSALPTGQKAAWGCLTSPAFRGGFFSRQLPQSAGLFPPTQAATSSSNVPASSGTAESRGGGSFFFQGWLLHPTLPTQLLAQHGLALGAQHSLGWDEDALTGTASPEGCVHPVHILGGAAEQHPPTPSLLHGHRGMLGMN